VPLKKFSNGEVFYPEDMDALVAASNMRFANAAARTALLTGSLAPTAGTLSTTTDDGAASRWIVQNGARWQPAASQVMFSYASTVGQNVPASSSGTITGWNTNLLGTRNVNGWFNPSSGIFQTGIAGWFEVTGGVSMPWSGAADKQVGVMLNTGTPNFIDWTMASNPYYVAGHPPAYQMITPVIVAMQPTHSLGLWVRNGTTSNFATPSDAGSPNLFTVRYLGGF